MVSELDEHKQCIPISELKPLQTEWLIKVLVLRRGPIRDYKTSNGEGVIRLVIFVDEEGKKVQGTLFNEQIQTWENYFEPLQSYYIEDGKILTPKANYLSVNTEVEISFHQHTKVAKCDNEFMTENFANGFISFAEAARLPMGTLFDVVGILLEVKALLGEGRRIRREVIITDDRYDRKTLILWGDLAEIEGAKLARLQHDNSVVAFCDIKSSIYQGEFGLSTTPVSSVLLDPKFEIAEDLQKWPTAMKACKIDIGIMPSRIMQQTKSVSLSDIIKGASANMKDRYCRFEANLIDIINLDDLWLKIVVSAKDVENIVLTLFGGARYFFGCDVTEYIHSTSEKKEDSPYYRKMEQRKGKLFSFLIKNPLNAPVGDKNKDLIVEEMHEVEKVDFKELAAEPSSTKKLRKRAIISEIPK